MERIPVLINRGGGAVAADPAIADKVAPRSKRRESTGRSSWSSGGECAVRCKAMPKRGEALLIVGGGDGTISCAASAMVGT